MGEGGEYIGENEEEEEDDADEEDHEPSSDLLIINYRDYNNRGGKSGEKINQ